MHLSRSARIALLFLLAFLFQSEKLQATPGTVPPGACLYALDPTADRAFQIAGAQSVYSACGLVVESRASDGFEMEGSETLYLENHAQVSVIGGASLTGQTKLWDTINNKQAQAVQTTSPGDPLSSIATPTSSTMISTSHAYYDMNSKPRNNTLSPGIYCGGLTIGNTNGMTFNFSPGVYIMAGGGFVLNSQAQVSGSGVTFYNTSSSGWGCSQSYSYTPITISGQVTANLSAPTSGSLNGILFFGNRAGCSTPGSCIDQINGGSTAVLNGALYFASDEIEITGSNVNGFLMLVADKIYINGNSNFGNNGDPFDGVTVNVLPASASLYASQTQQFTATVGNTANPAVTWSISPSSSGTISSSGLYTAPSSVTAQQAVTVTATSQDDDTKYGTATVTLYPPRTTPAISWAAPAPIGYGTALSAAQLDATTSVAGTFAYSPAIGSVLSAGLQALTVTFTPSNTFLYNSATASVPLTVIKATPIVTWPAPSPIAYGTPLSSTKLDASALVAGSFVYAPAAGAVLTAGVHTLSVTFTPSDAADYNTVTQTVQLTVNPVAPTITFTVPNQTYGVAPFTVSATSNSLGAFTYSVVSGPATISGSAVTITGVGTVVLQASQVANGSYSAGTQNATFAVAEGEQTITFTAPVSPVTYGVSPVALSASSSSGLPVSFSVVSGPATISGSTLTITGPGIVVVAANQGGNTDYAAATQVTQSIVVNPSVSITITPSSAALGASQTLQFTAAVSNTGNTGVNWTISPAGIGLVDQTGFYTAPALIPSQQAVTLTATSQADTTKSASATVTLIPTQCTANGYSYQRAIVIDHTKIPNSDQVNFPFLFSTTDAAFKTTTNGGHVTSPSGYDIIFASDPAGQNILNFEMEEYDPVAGQVVAWVRIPTLSHNSDTVIYAFYGNPSITASQQNRAGVWDSNYVEVLHLDENTGTTAFDSTANGNNGTKVSQSSPAAISAGKIGGAQSFNGSSDFVTLPPSMTGGLSVFSVSLWTKTIDTTSNGTYWNRPEFLGDSTGGGSSGDFGVNTNNGYLGMWSGLNGGGDNSLVATNMISDGNWHLIDAVNDGSTISLYMDGQVTDQTLSSGLALDTYGWYLGAQHYQGGGAAFFHQGSIDEFRFSNATRSADWIAIEYNNQSSPSTFYALNSENAQAVIPANASLYASQIQQFAATGICGSGVIWSMPPGAPGTLTSSGLYTAPANIASQQTVTITATSQANGTVIGTAVLTLLPPPPPITLVAAAQPPYTAGSSQGFVATLLDQNGAPEPGVAVTFTVNGVNNSTGSVTTDSNGLASFAYVGANSGSDTVQASAIVSGQQSTSNSLSVSWVAQALPTPQGAIVLQAGVNLGLTGLCGAFTDSNGSVIQPIAIGAAAKVFAVPAGATQLQLGVVDDRYGDNAGSGFAVEVNGGLFTVLPTSMPWLWVAGGLNTDYKFGIQDGTAPIVALTGLTAEQAVSIAYQSGTVSAGPPFWPYVNADGDRQDIVGASTGSTGTYEPTEYITSSTYPIGQPIPVTAVVSNGSGNALPDVPVVLTVTGANARQYQATTDSTGTAAFSYAGANAGTDILQARAYPSGEASLLSSQASVTWASLTSLPQTGSLKLTPAAVQPLPAQSSQSFKVYAADASGAPLSGLNVTLDISGTDNLVLRGTTDATGYATILYQNGNPGTASAVAIAFIDNVLVYSNTVTVPWTLSASGTTASGGNGSTIDIGISALSTVTLPNTLQLNGTVTDSNLPAGSLPNITWSQVSGPGTVTFTTPQQAVTTASFGQAGNYVVELSASDSTTSGSLQFPVTVSPVPGTVQGWIGAPLYGSTVTGIVPITLASGITLQSGGTLGYYPASNPGNVTPLPITSQSGTISTLDTTTLANGTYWIQLQATGTSGEFEYSLILVTVAGNYKPGRVTATVTDLVVPATGLAINIQRTYDSLNAGTSGDFGYGWNLGINVNLSVDPAGNVTFTLGGQRRTFYLTPQPNGFLPYDDVVFTPEAGFHGTLTDSAPGCQDLFDFVVPSGSLWFCVDGGQYNPPGYIYTDPNGTSYLISASGALQAIQDRSGNGLTITPNGITSSTGLSVPFKRDAQNRIYEIDDPQGNQYLYGYDTNGQLVSVTYPNTTQPSTYAYTPTGHYYLSGTDFRNNPLPVTAYYDSATDGRNSALDGRLLSVTNTAGTTSYAYTLSTTSTINGVSVANTGVTTITYPDSGIATMIYDSYGMLLSSTDPLGLTTTNVYDSKHNLTSVTDPLGHTTTYAYDQNGNKTSSTYPATATSTNTTSTTQYNQYSEPTQTTDELGNVRLFNYDANYNPQSVTDSIGTLASFQFNSNQTLGAGAIGFDIATAPAKASQFTYDANGNLVGRTDALGRTTSFVYNSLGQKASVTTPTPTAPTGGPASTTNYTYDQLGNLAQTAAPLGRTTSSTYDGNGNKQYDVDANGHKTSYIYDALNRLIETDYPDGTKATKTYDFRNNVVTETDQNGNVTQHSYDLAGRQLSVIRGYGTSSASTTTYAYDNAGRKTSETDALGHSTAYTYDAAGNLTAIAGVHGNFTYTYDNARNRISQTDANGNKTQFQYDARKRLTTTTYPDHTTTVNSYDGPGNLASVTDQAGNVVQYTYDAANQLKTVVQTASPSTSNNTNYYGYDPLGNLTNLTDENLHTTQNTFDLFNEPISKTLPAAQTETRNYDNAGNLTSLVHFNQVTTTYTYDTLNRLLSRATPGEATVSFTYTPSGKYLTSTAGDGTVNYSYDSLDRLTTKATPEGTLSYTYDAAGHVASILSSNANGASVAYTYDDLNRLSTVVDSRLSGNTTTNYAYDQASNLSTATYPNGVQSVMTYDALNRITGLATQNSGYLYQRGPTGNLTSATELNGRTVNWSFDGIYRLTNEAIASDPDQVNGSVGYQLDPVGNRTSDASSLAGINSGSFGYNADDEVNTETYDANGNTLFTGGKNFTYDAENHLTGMNVSGTVVSIVYDAFGNRVAKTVNGVTTKYLVEDDVNPTGYPQVLDELTNGVVTRTYTYGLQRISEDQIINGGWTPSFYGYDGGGNVRQLTNATGAVTDTYEYDAFGNQVYRSGSMPNSYMYRGEQYDPDLGLYYLRARYYNPATGRFLSRDPEEGKAFDPRTLHKYLYAGGDPVNRIDPSGRADLEENFLVRFTSHGLDHLIALGLELSQGEVEAYVEMLVRQYVVDMTEGVGEEFWLQFAMEELGGVPWEARVFIVTSAMLSVGTYYPLP